DGIRDLSVTGVQTCALPISLYHAGAVFASNYLVTLQRAAVRLGVPAEGLVPLMQGTIEHGFELTGPIARGDWETVEAHKQAIRRSEERRVGKGGRARGGGAE